MTKQLSASECTAQEIQSERIAQETRFFSSLIKAGAHVWRDDEISAYMEKMYRSQPCGPLCRALGPEAAQLICFAVSVCAGAGVYWLLQLGANIMKPITDLDVIPILLAFAGAYWLINKYLVSLPDDWQENGLCYPDMELYWRDGVQRKLPAEAIALKSGIKALLPDAAFTVSFIGRDPILWCSWFDGKERRKAAVYVWDEIGGENIRILPPR